MKAKILNLTAFFLILSGWIFSCAKIEDAIEYEGQSIGTRSIENLETPYFYYYKGEKQYFELDTRRVFVSVTDKLILRNYIRNSL